MKVSVIIPVYNAASFLDKSIQSALDQKQTQEVILIDDRSTDGSWEKCSEWVEKDNRVRLFRNEGIKGAGAARNVGLKNATCEYIAFLDADDYYLEGRFDEDEKLFKQRNDIDVCSSSLKIMAFSEKYQQGMNSYYKHEKILGWQPSFTIINSRNNFKNENIVSIHGLTVRKTVFTKIGTFDEGLKQCQDTDIILRLLLETTIISGNFEKPVVVYFRHNSNTTNNYTETTYYRRKAAKKHFHLVRKYNVAYSIQAKYFKDFMEYDYLWIFQKKFLLKKLTKLVMLPFWIYRIFSKVEPEYDEKRKIFDGCKDLLS